MQRADAVDGDADGIAGFEGEFVTGHDTGAGEQQHAIGEEVVTAEVVHQVGQVAYDFAGADATAKYEMAGAVDCDRDGQCFGVGDGFAEGNHRPDRTTAPVHFGLGQVERIFAFDVT